MKQLFSLPKKQNTPAAKAPAPAKTRRSAGRKLSVQKRGTAHRPVWKTALAAALLAALLAADAAAYPFCGARAYASNAVGTLNSYPKQSCRLYEPAITDAACYSTELLAQAKAYSDTAIVVIGRFAGESNDCPKTQYKQVEKGGPIVTDMARTYLDLSAEEEALLAYVGQNYQNVIVLVNAPNTMALGAVETTPGVDACLLVGCTGEAAAAVLPDILYGKISPSGRTADTYAYDFSTAASYANAGAEGLGTYTQAEGLYPADGKTKNANVGDAPLYAGVSYLDYAEGIYTGYAWYETADAEGYWDAVQNVHGIGYAGVVQYPFGYGLSECDDTGPNMEHGAGRAVRAHRWHRGRAAGLLRLVCAGAEPAPLAVRRAQL